MNSSTGWMFAAAAVVVSAAGPLAAVEARRVVWEKRVCTGITAKADELRGLLADEVRKMLDAGHLLPYFTRRGEQNAIWCFTNPGNTVLALARAYPYLSDKMKKELRAYLRKEMAVYPPCSDKVNSPTDAGKPRQLHALPQKDFEWRGGRRAMRRPRVHNVYAVWLYAENTGDWAYVRDHWPAVTAFYDKHAKDASAYFGGMAAPIGLARMAAKLGKADAAAKAAAAETALRASDHEEKMRMPMFERYGFRAKWHGKFHALGYHFLHMTPEVARYVRERPAARKKVLDQVAECVHRMPMWHISQASCFMRCYGESHAISPYVSAMIFPVKAWIERVPFAKLRDMVSAADAPRGDLFYIERLVTAIEACGRVRWQRLPYAPRVSLRRRQRPGPRRSS